MYKNIFKNKNDKKDEDDNIEHFSDSNNYTTYITLGIVVFIV